MLGVRVVALLLLCSTPVSSTEEGLSTGLKAKLEEMGVDSMQKRAGVGGVVGLVGGYLAKQTQAASMHTAHALHVHPHTHHPPHKAATALPQDAVLNACLIGGVVAGGACALGYLDTDELVERVHGAVDSSTGYVEATLAKLMGHRAAERITKSRVALSKVAKSMPGLAGGAVFGALLGYRIG